MVPLALTVGTLARLGGTSLFTTPRQHTTAAASAAQTVGAAAADARQTQSRKRQGLPEEKPQELGEAETEVWSHGAPASADAPPEEMGSLGESDGTSAAGKFPKHFYAWFWGLAALSALARYLLSGAWTATSLRS